jgi:hypothetical protein
VNSRKARFREIKSEIAALVDHGGTTVSRGDVEAAVKLQQEARNLIDQGLGLLDHDHENVDYQDFECPICGSDPLFAEERFQLRPCHIKRPVTNSLLLPAIFYHSANSFGQTDNGQVPTEAEMEVHTMIIYLTAGGDPRHPPPRDFILRMARRINVEFFRTVSRDVVKQCKYTLPCMQYILTLADQREGDEE